MKSKKAEAIILFLTGLLLLFFAWFVYDVYEPISNNNSPRLKDLNGLINLIGQLPLAILIGGMGLFICVIGIRKIRK